MIHM